MSIRAAIIDDGAVKGIFKNEICIDITDDNILIDPILFTNGMNHASECALIIKKYSDIEHIEWLNIRVLDPVNKKGKLSSLVTALKYCLDKDIKLIHMSIGSTDYHDFDKINDIIIKLLNKETLIVAALSNDNKITYPACIDGVIGVKADPSLNEKTFDFVDSPWDNINIRASSKHFLRYGKRIAPSVIANSFAAPTVTSYIVEMIKMNKDITIKEVFVELKSLSGNILSSICDIRSDEIDIPTIGIFMNDSVLTKKIAMSLRERFRTDDYNATLLIEKGEIYNKLRLDGFKDHLSHHIRFCMSEVVLVGAVLREISEVYKEFDIAISDDRDKALLISEFALDPVGMSIDAIYSLILKKLL